MSYNPPPPPLGGSDPYGAAGQGQWGGGGAPGQWASGYGGPPGPPPNNNMGLAIGAVVANVLCLSCLGLVPAIIAVVMATQVKDKWNRGDVNAATDSARKARLFSFIAFGVLAFGLILNLILIATGVIDFDTTTTN